MKKKKDVLGFTKQLKDVADLYPTQQVLDEEGNVINEALFPEITDDEIVTLFKQMLWSRTLNDRSTVFARQGRLGFFAPTEGQEASQIASNFAFEKEDVLYPGYRDIPQLIQHGLPMYKAFLWSKGHAEGNVYPEDLHAMVPQIIIGAQIVQATGTALGMKLKDTKHVSYTYTGDGGSSQGDFYEGINFAGSFKVPAVFYIQNNGYAISTPRSVQTCAPTLAQKAAAAGIPGVAVDGMDALAVFSVSQIARKWAVEGNGPVLIEIISDRFGAHSLSGDDPKRYRDQEQLEKNKQREPLIRLRKYLEKKSLWNEEMEQSYLEEVNEEITEAMKQAEAVAPQKVSSFLKNTFEIPTPVINEQIKVYEEREEK